MDKSIDWERFRVETAAKILVALLQDKGEGNYIFRTPEEIAVSAVKQADALIRELDTQAAKD